MLEMSVVHVQPQMWWQGVPHPRSGTCYGTNNQTHHNQQKIHTKTQATELIHA